MKLFISSCNICRCTYCIVQCVKLFTPHFVHHPHCGYPTFIEIATNMLQIHCQTIKILIMRFFFGGGYGFGFCVHLHPQLICDSYTVSYALIIIAQSYLLSQSYFFQSVTRFLLTKTCMYWNENITDRLEGVVRIR